MGSLLVENWCRGAAESESDGIWEEMGFGENQGTPILLLLVCTGAKLHQGTINNWVQKNRHRGKENHFYCFLDRDFAYDILGPDFSYLANAIKETRKE